MQFSVYSKKGTLNCTSFGLVGQHLLPSKTDLRTVLLRTALQLLWGSIKPMEISKKVPWCENLRLLRIILIRCSLYLEEGKLCQSQVKVFCVLCELGLPTILAVFALCVVLLEPASTARGQNRVSISIVRYYFRKM